MDDRRQSGLWEQNAQGVLERKVPAGPYQYYQPPTSSTHRRSYSERAAGLTDDPLTAIKAATQNGLERSTSLRSGNNKTYNPETVDITRARTSQYPPTKTTRAQETYDNENDEDDEEEEDDDENDHSIPENLRRKAWSPEQLSPVSPTSTSQQALPTRHISDSSRHVRRGSVPDRSPLQSLEVKLDNISKEEKRARIEEAEKRARDDSVGEGDLARSTTIHNVKGRVVSDGSRRGNEAVSSTARNEAGERFQRASYALKSGLGAEQMKSTNNGIDLNRDRSQRYRLSQDTKWSASAFENAAAARGKAAHERRKVQALGALHSTPKIAPADAVKPGSSQKTFQAIQPDTTWGPARASVPSSTRNLSNSPERTRSKRLQKQPPVNTQAKTARSEEDSPTMGRQSYDSRTSMESDKRLLQGNRLGAETGKTHALVAPVERDIIPKEQVRTSEDTAVPYDIPPQTAAAQQAKERVTFAPDINAQDSAEKNHHLRNILGGHHAVPRGYQTDIKPLDEWRQAQTARLTARHLESDDQQANSNTAWWDKSSKSTATKPTTHYEEQATQFNPALYLKCGPLLRFTGLSRGRRTGSGAHTWRGSVMIVTEDASSDLAKPPVLRLFTQPAELHNQDNHDDPVTGQLKTSRIGRPIYVRSIQELEHGVDLSRQENNKGLYSATRPTTHSSRIKHHDGEQLGKHEDVQGHRLHVEHGCTFWRFNLEVELGHKPARIAYRINSGPAIGFWVPARGETMNIMFHSCNGFSLTVNSAEFCGPDPLWRDVLNRHQSRPFNVMIGGGDQIYNDAAVRDTTLFKEWLQIKNPEHKHHADFTVEMQHELETFFFERYAMWFSQGLFGMANAQIPMVNIYDDHDIIDGFGSYPHHFMSSPVFAGLGAIAFKYYMLFQHQSLPMETTAEEPCWVLGSSPGPYINELNRSIFVWLGDKVALLAVDCRTERMRDEILSQKSYDIIFDRCRHELVAGDSKHLIVLLGVPIAYPRLNFLENILTSRMLDPIKAIGRTGALGGFVNKFDGGVEILDDLDDHWTAKHHKAERNWFIQELQELAAEKSVRVTILGGDVHLGAIGQFYSNKRLGLAKDRDHRYMPNVISSAIVNTPPPPMMADVLNRRNKVHHLDKETDEDMIPMFSHDVDGSRRNNQHLMPRRNFAMIREYMPGTTPPPTPPSSPPPADNRSTGNTAHIKSGGNAINVKPGENIATPQANDNIIEQADHEEPPGPLTRNKSSSKTGSSLLRRLSLRGRNPPVSLNSTAPARPFSFHEGASTEHADQPQRSNSLTAASAPQRPNLSFHRRPTNLSLKEARQAAAKGGPEAEDGALPGHINLEHGLDISLCMEVDQHDPAGRTEPYRLLVPALWYGGGGDMNTSTLPARRPSLFKRMTSGRRQAQGNTEREQTSEQFYDDAEDPATPTQAALPRTNRKEELEDLQATATNAGSSRQPPSRSAYHQRGYNLGSPPVGDYESQHDHHAARQVHDEYADEDESNLTLSEVDTREGASPEPEHRRASKAERFFGIGNEHGHEQPQERQYEHDNDTGKKSKRWSLSNWKPWETPSRGFHGMG